MSAGAQNLEHDPSPSLETRGATDIAHGERATRRPAPLRDWVARGTLLAIELGVEISDLTAAFL
jgi:hypothetical protein